MIKKWSLIKIALCWVSSLPFLHKNNSSCSLSTCMEWRSPDCHGNQSFLILSYAPYAMIPSLHDIFLSKRDGVGCIISAIIFISLDMYFESFSAENILGSVIWIFQSTTLLYFLYLFIQHYNSQAEEENNNVKTQRTFVQPTCL